MRHSMPAQLTVPQQQAIRALLATPEKRLNHLYWILDKNGRSIRFRMNAEQTHLHRHAHTRNLILKARQLGFSTYVSLRILDACLHIPNYKAGIIDRTLPDAASKLDKIKYAYQHLDHLPDTPTPLDHELAQIGAMLKEYHQGIKIKEKEILFPNGSSIYISTSYRGGTLQLLHISELGSIAYHEPRKANEIITGALPSVGANCTIFMESTHEGGKYGEHYRQIEASMDNIGKPLTPLHFKFFFYSWHQHPEYQLPDATPAETDESRRYFAQLEQEQHTTISPAQRAWYLANQKTYGSRMKQEYPSTPAEALNPITDGAIYSLQLDTLREKGRLSARFEHDPHRPIYTAWDLGIADYMSIWWIQPGADGLWHILDNYTANQLPLSHYIDILRQKDAVYNRCAACILPHDSARKDINANSYDTALRQAGYTCIRTPITANLWASIDTTRQFLATCLIHERCHQPTRLDDGATYIAGMDALANYRTAPPGARGALAPSPLHDINSHAADALRTFADAAKLGLISPLQPTFAHRTHTGSTYKQNFFR